MTAYTTPNRQGIIYSAMDTIWQILLWYIQISLRSEVNTGGIFYLLLAWISLIPARIIDYCDNVSMQGYKQHCCYTHSVSLSCLSNTEYQLFSVATESILQTGKTWKLYETIYAKYISVVLMDYRHW